MLADFFVEQIMQEVPGLKKRAFSKAAMEQMLAYHWPGNVRELKFAAERAACMAQGHMIDVGDLSPEITERVLLLGDTGDGFEGQIRAFELGLLRRTLNEVDWNQREAAKQLQLSYDQFRHLYRKYKLSKIT